MTLAGCRIVITRAKHQATDFARMITQADGTPILYPCIAIAPPADTSELDIALQNLQAFDTVIFTSTNTVTAVQKRLDALRVQFDWRTIRIASIGDKTDTAVHAMVGQRAEFVPSHYQARVLADELPVRKGEKIFLPLSALSDGHLTDLLIARGADVTSVNAYQTVIGTGGADVPALLHAQKIHALTFTSGSTVTNFVTRIAPQTAFDLPAVCIGASTHSIAVEAGFTQAVHPENYSLQGMMHCLHNVISQSV